MDITLLKKDQIWGDNALGVIKQAGTVVGATDLTIALGGWGIGYQLPDGTHSCAVWTASRDDYGGVLVDHYDGEQRWGSPYGRSLAARPALPPSATSAIGSRKAATGGGLGTQYYGEYPQTIVSWADADVLEMAYQAQTLQKTGNVYTFDNTPIKNAEQKPFVPTEYPEYERQGTRYIRINARPADTDTVFSNGHKPVKGDVYWFKVEPIEWMVDASGWWVSRRALFAGIQFNPSDSYDGNFNATFIKKYMDKYFVPQMQQSMNMGRGAINRASVTPETGKQKQFSAARQRVGLVTIDETPMSVREQIDFYVKTGKSFMLHGPSGVGKTARVERVDPDLTAVPLWNGVLPEDIVGKVRYPNGTTAPLTRGRADGEDAFANPDALADGGVWVAPDWYTELVRKCNAQPDRQHVLFIDEVTNAKPTTQSLIFHVVLKKSISPSKGKLPKNAVVVLAGNDKVDSGAAYNMPAPLFRRMSGHIYLNANLPDWLEWASEKSAQRGPDASRLNIHPLVSNFLAANPRAFYSAYNEDDPQQWAVDPRGWQQVSDIIYDNNNVLRRELIENKIGNEYATALLGFARQPVLTLDDVLNGDYTDADIPHDMSQRMACALAMRHVDERNVGIVRDFIRKNLGAENLAIFDSVWVSGNEERALAIAGLTKQR